MEEVGRASDAVATDDKNARSDDVTDIKPDTEVHFLAIHAKVRRTNFDLYERWIGKRSIMQTPVYTDT
jgi:hypothetical protein